LFYDSFLPLRVKVENNHEASKQYKKTKIS
jgi:hypothetical protein